MMSAQLHEAFRRVDARAPQPDRARLRSAIRRLLHDPMLSREVATRLRAAPGDRPPEIDEVDAALAVLLRRRKDA